MVNAFYAIIIILVALVAIARGFRAGIFQQTASLLGFAFGAVAARVLVPQYTPSFKWAANLSQAPEFADFTTNLVCGVTIYSVVFAFFYLFSPFFRSALAVLEVGIFNRILGAFFMLVKNLLWLSIFFNLLLCFSSASRLLYYERSNDGNLVAAVMQLTPAILGCYGAEDFAHFNQLKEAKSISCNFNTQPDVIFT